MSEVISEKNKCHKCGSLRVWGFIDDTSTYQCRGCGIKWKTIDPKNRMENRVELEPPQEGE